MSVGRELVEIFSNVACLAPLLQKVDPERYRTIFFHDPEMNLQPQALQSAYRHVRKKTPAYPDVFFFMEREGIKLQVE